MNFCSDNVTGVAPEIMEALVAANAGAAMPYGDDEITKRLDARFSELFERPVTVLPVATGSAANVLGLSVMVPPYGAVYCHRDAHINTDECGAPEFYTGGAKLVLLDGAHARMDAGDLAAVLAESEPGYVHRVQPAAVSITQATEAGTVYTPAHVRAIADVAHARGLGVQMDGARFANAVASLRCAPADVTWRAGVDVLAFGATKNGAMGAEAIVFFDPALARDVAYRRKRGGHLLSKLRFLSAQLEAYVTEDLWLRNATHANRMAALLADRLSELPGVTLLHPREANEVFVSLPTRVQEGLLADGFRFYRRGNGTAVRLVTAFDTRERDVLALVEAAHRHTTKRVEMAAR
jgi:threonine aldolase